MEIENLSSEEKSQVLNDLLKDILTSAPDSKKGLIETIESLTASSVDLDIETWATRGSKF